MVSVIVLVVSVVLVIDPCVKFGTTGTAIAALTFARAITPTARASFRIFMTHLTVSSVTNCPVA